MKLTINSDFILFGRNASNGYSTNFFHQWEGADEASRAKLYLNFTIQSNVIDGEEFAQEIFESIRNSFYAYPERDPYERFEEALNEVNKVALHWRDSKQVKFFSEVHAVIAILHGTKVYITQCGMAEAYLLRRRHTTVISDGLADNDKDRDALFVNVASGDLEDLDSLVFSSVRILRSISKGDMAKIFTRDTSLARSFQVLREAIESDTDENVNILALNISFSDGEPVQDEDVLNSGRSVFSKMLDFIPSISKDKGLKSPKSSLKAIDLKSLTNLSEFGKDKVLVSLILVILILIGGLAVVRAKSVTKKRLAQYEEILTEVQESLNEAETRGTFDKSTAVEMLEVADLKLRTVIDAGEYRNKSFELQDKIKSVRDRLDQIIRVDNPILLADLTTQRETVNALGVLPFEESSYVYEYNALFPVMLDKLLEPLTIDENESVIDGVRSLDAKSLLFLTKSHKILEFRDNFITFLDTQDPAWKTAIALEVYGDRLYLLDTSEGTLWRYRRGREGFSGAEQYTSDANLTDAVDIAIDGSVYILKKDGTIVKYYAGEVEEEFAVLRAPMSPLTKPTKIFTEFEFNQVLILEPASYRILAYNKDIKNGNLVYSHQYHFSSGIGELKDMYVDKTSNKLFVLTSDKLYQVDM